MSVSGGWGTAPVQAASFEPASAALAAFLSLFARAGCAVATEPAARHPERLFAVAVQDRPQRGGAERGRAQPGLDLFLGQNRTHEGSGDAKAR